MEAEAAKYIGAGIACLGMGGAGIGLGTIFGNYLAGALRNGGFAIGSGPKQNRPACGRAVLQIS